MEETNLLAFFKALGDANRLKIVGLLAQNSCSVEQLAAMLELRPSTVSHHLARLARVGLVSARAEGYYSLYQLETKSLEAMARKLLSEGTLPALAEDVDKSAYERKVLADFTMPDGSLKTIPSQQKKRLVILRHLVSDFEPESHYSEKQVNEILARYHTDTATLRREMIASGLLKREKGIYWRVD